MIVYVCACDRWDSDRKVEMEIAAEGWGFWGRGDEVKNEDWGATAESRSDDNRLDAQVRIRRSMNRN